MPGLGRWSVGPCCGCTPASCNVTVAVRGCASKPLPGATVAVYTDNTLATLLDTGTTNSSGQATLNVGAVGTYWRVVSRAPRFSPSTGSLVVSSCGANTGLYTLTAAAGYACNSYCLLPLPETLYYSDTTGKTITLTLQAGGPDNGKWTGTGGGVTIKLSFPIGQSTPTILVEDSRVVSVGSKSFTCVDPFAYTSTGGNVFVGTWTYTITE